MYQTYVEDVLKKVSFELKISKVLNLKVTFLFQGYLMKKGFLLPTLRYLWFVLRPGELTYYKDSQSREPSGVIHLDVNSWADAVNNGGKPERRFILSTPQHRCIELVAEDHRGRLQWLSALQISIQHSTEKIGYQRALAYQRRSIRQVSETIKNFSNHFLIP